MDEDGEDRNQPPSARRREQAREQGRVAYSADLNASVLLLAAILLLWYFGPDLALSLRGNMRMYVARYVPHFTDLPQSGAVSIGLGELWHFVQAIGLFSGLMFVLSLSMSLAQTGLQFSPEAVGFKWEKLDPVAGLKRIVSMSGLMRALVAILKVVFVVAVAYWMLADEGQRIAGLGGTSLQHSISTTWDIAIRLLIAVALSLLVLGAGDWAWQKYRFEKSLMMTRQELIEEHRAEEGDPQIKGRRRQMARQMARREKMMKEVPKATVVVTNPTHLAIALRYDRNEAAAPIVLAKGRGANAERIVGIARRHNIPIVERKPIAQALFKTVNIGQEIPAELYYAVSEIIAYVYKLRGRL